VVKPTSASPRPQTPVVVAPSKPVTPARNGTPSLLRKTTPIVNTPQPTNNTKPNIVIKPSLNPGRLTSTPIIDVAETAETRQKKIEKEERMREAGKNGETRKRPRNQSTEQQTKNVKKVVVPFTTPPVVPTGIPETPINHSVIQNNNNFSPLLTKESFFILDNSQDILRWTSSCK